MYFYILKHLLSILFPYICNMIKKSVQKIIESNVSKQNPGLENKVRKMLENRFSDEISNLIGDPKNLKRLDDSAKPFAELLSCCFFHPEITIEEKHNIESNIEEYFKSCYSTGFSREFLFKATAELNFLSSSKIEKYFSYIDKNSMLNIKTHYFKNLKKETLVIKKRFQDYLHVQDGLVTLVVMQAQQNNITSIYEPTILNKAIKRLFCSEKNYLRHKLKGILLLNDYHSACYKLEVSVACDYPNKPGSFQKSAVGIYVIMKMGEIYANSLKDALR